jgi:hypothetical protein
MISAGFKMGVEGVGESSSTSISFTVMASALVARAIEGSPLPLTIAFFCFLGGEGARSESSSSTSISSSLAEKEDLCPLTGRSRFEGGR